MYVSWHIHIKDIPKVRMELKYYNNNKKTS